MLWHGASAAESSQSKKSRSAFIFEPLDSKKVSNAEPVWRLRMPIVNDKISQEVIYYQTENQFLSDTLE